MAPFILWLVEWIAVPLIMISGLVLAVTLAKATEEVGARIGSWAGLLAGLVAGSGFAITQLPGGRSPADGDRFHFSFVALAAGVVAGIGTPYLVRLAHRAPQGVIGALTLILSASSSLAILNYLFNGAARDFTEILAVSLLFGVLLWGTFNGGKVPELLADMHPRTLGRASRATAGGQYHGGEPGPGYGQPPTT